MDLLTNTMYMCMYMTMTMTIRIPHRILSVPRTSLTHRSLSHSRHDFLLHIIAPLLQINILQVISPLPLLLPHIPPPYYDHRARNRHGPIQPETLANSRCSRFILEIEESHREDGSEIGAGEEDGTEERNRFHRARIAFCGMSELALFFGHLEVKFRFFLGDDVVELVFYD